MSLTSRNGRERRYLLILEKRGCCGCRTCKAARPMKIALVIGTVLCRDKSVGAGSSPPVSPFSSESSRLVYPMALRIKDTITNSWGRSRKVLSLSGVCLRNCSMTICNAASAYDLSSLHSQLSAASNMESAPELAKILMESSGFMWRQK